MTTESLHAEPAAAEAELKRHMASREYTFATGGSCHGGRACAAPGDARAYRAIAPPLPRSARPVRGASGLTRLTPPCAQRLTAHASRVLRRWCCGGPYRATHRLCC